MDRFVLIGGSPNQALVFLELSSPFLMFPGSWEKSIQCQSKAAGDPGEQARSGSAYDLFRLICS